MCDSSVAESVLRVHLAATYTTFCFPNVAIFTNPAASTINFRLKGAAEPVFIGEKRLNSASVSENNLGIKTTVELGNT